MNYNIQKSVDRNFVAPDLEAAEEDWVADSRGGESMALTAFHDALFELADVWVASIDVRGTYYYARVCVYMGWRVCVRDKHTKQASGCSHEAAAGA